MREIEWVFQKLDHLTCCLMTLRRSWAARSCGVLTCSRISKIKLRGASYFAIYYMSNGPTFILGLRDIFFWNFQGTCRKTRKNCSAIFHDNRMIIAWVISNWRKACNAKVTDLSEFYGNFRFKTPGCRKIKSVFRDVKWCFNASWGLKG